MSENEVEVDPELLDDPEEGVGNESSYSPQEVEYDHSQFELTDDELDGLEEEDNDTDAV